MKGISRRHFLQATGFAFMGTIMLGCGRAPEEEDLPYLRQPEGSVAGRANLYATTCGGCGAGCGILARSLDGRPVKLEGNPEHPLSKGGLCAVGQASLLGLYDSQRLRNPVISGRPADWAEVDRLMLDRLRDLRAKGAAVRYLSVPIVSPNKRARVDGFLATFSDARLIQTSPTSHSPIAEAHEQTHGVRAVPRYRFDRAEIIVSVDADFLGTWISPVEFTAGWSSRRRGDDPTQGFSEHIQFESRLSLTGTKADLRLRIAPSERIALLNRLLLHVRRLANHPTGTIQAGKVDSVDDSRLQAIAARLWNHRGAALVVCGAEDLSAQLLCNALNQMLGSYGRTVDLSQPRTVFPDDEGELDSLLDEIAAGRVDALFIDGLNPVLDFPGGPDLAEKLDALPLVVHFGPYEDETAEHANLVCPDHHFLEAWSDSMPVAGITSFTQPLISPLGSTRPVVESLTVWTTGTLIGAREQLLARYGGDESHFHRLLSDGFEIHEARPKPGSYRPEALQSVQSASRHPLELVLYTKVAMPSSAHAFNPWLHELPDPVTKIVWDNTASLSPELARSLSVGDGDVVRISVEGEGSIELPVLVQPGQHDSVVAVALGYGSTLSRRFAEVGPDWLEEKPTLGTDGLVGVCATPLLAFEEGRRRFSGRAITITATGEHRELARTQDYQSIDVPEHLAPEGIRRRPMIRETTVAALLHSGSEEHEKEHREGNGLWPDDHPYEGHHWGMVIDLTACTGCSACVTACQVENNVPVVGKDEVRRNREMHWIRIDRYYTGDGDDLEVAHQPMMCHQCDNAPCETVCPVLATVHSDEGLNEQVYNRCIGTRYCMNNCPYKVRRFNWFEYAHEDAYENLTLNPEVTVRSRGIMEKCSFCVQRIQEAKVIARQEGREVRDGDIRTACQQSCPAQAIVFGDTNDPESAVSRAIGSRRHYRVLEEIGIRPSVGYASLVRNRPEEPEGRHHDS